MVKKVTTTITANLDQSGKLKITVGGEIDSEIAVSILNVVSAILTENWDGGFVTYNEKTLTGIDAVKQSLDQIENKLPISDVDTGGER